MRHVTIFVLLLVLGLLGTSTLLAKPQYQEIAPGKYIAPGQIIVKFKPEVGDAITSQAASRVFQKCQAQKVEKLFKEVKNSHKRQVIDLSRIFQVDIPENISVLELCKDLTQDPAVEYAEPVFNTRPHLVPNDSLYSMQSHLPQIKAEEAWDVAQGSADVIIGIVDTGVDWDHPDLANSIWRNADEELDGTDTDGNGFIDDIRGWDFVTGVTDAADGEDGDEPDNNPMDFDGHGTHCSGLAAAITNNEVGVAGIGSGCKIMPLRIGWHTQDGDGLGNSAWMARAFVYAADNGAHAVNLSYGNSGQAIQDAAVYAFQNGVVIASSAGNDETDVTSDALDIHPFVIKIAAVDPYDKKSWFSNFGDWVTVSAPGGDHSPGLLSTYPDDDYYYASGTSQASPLVAGLVGLVKSHFPEMTAADLIFQVVGTADNIDSENPNYVGQLGTGRINAYRALTETVVPEPKINLKSYTFSDETGNNNGIIDIGETVQVVFELENVWGPAHNVTATFESDDWAISIDNGVANLGTVHGIDDFAASQSTTNADAPFVISIDPMALPHPISGTLVLNGDNGYHQEFPMVLPIQPSILFVDDDSEDGDAAPEDISNSYYAALAKANISAFHYDRNVQGANTKLDQYPTVIWGCEAASPGLIYVDYYYLQKYLDNGGNLFLAGQNLGWDLNDPSSPVTNDGSKAFFTDYLHANYVTNESMHHALMSHPDDPIAKGMQISVNEPGRPAEEQTPCEITPANGGVSIFNYPNGNSGAVRYASDYRMVYFAFGGLEAITEADKRDEIMRNTLDWLNGLEVKHRPLGDTENTTEDYAVNVVVKSETKAVSRVDLYWNAAGILPFDNSVAMTALDDSTYQAFIPAQDSGRVVYTIYVENEAGYYSYKINEFTIGADNQAPTISIEAPLGNTLDKFGPYELTIDIFDNQAVDTAKVWVFHAKKGAAYDSTKMQLVTDDAFRGLFTANATYGDTIVYFVKAFDTATNQNSTVSEPFEFVLGMDSFEDKKLAGWEVVAGDWGLDSTQVAAGNFALTESPWRNIGPNEEHILQLKSPLDLADSDNAMLVFQTQYSLQRNMTLGYIEVSPDTGKTWEEIYKVTGLRRSWGQVELSLLPYVGQQVLLRLRVESKANATSNFDGWYLDEMYLRAGIAVNVAKNPAVRIPDQFVLRQNYPNPFNPATRISFGIPKASRVKLVVYNLLGRRVKTLLDQKQAAGFHQIVWDGTNDQGKLLSSGVYFYRLEADGFSQTRKMLWMK